MTPSDYEPQLRLTPYTIALAITTVVAILASPVASSVVSAQLQQWFSLAAIVLPALMTILFVNKQPAVQRFKARLFSRGK